MVEAARHCRLYLTVRATPSALLERSLTRAFAEVDVACVLLRGPAAEVPGWDAELRGLTLERDIALLVENDIEWAVSIGADGVHLSPDAGLYAQARSALGERSIIGVGCLESRHEAMALAERGADYVAFGKGDADTRAETIAWWSDIFVVPCVAWDVETPEEAERFANAGADFVALTPAVIEAENADMRVGAVDAALRGARSAA